MMTSSALRDADRLVPVKVNYSKARAKYAKGGLAKAAEDVRGAGRMGDDMVVHVNKREFEEMRQRWGDPTINPDTNLPEFFLGDLFSGIGDLVSGGAGLISDGAGDWLTNNPWAAEAIGSGLLGAGIGQLAGGDTKSTLWGAGLGALAPSVLGGSSLFSGLFGGGEGAADAGIGDDNGPPGLKPGAADKGGGGLGSIFGGGGKGGMMKPLIGALAVANMVNALSGGAKGSNKAQKDAEEQNKKAQENFNKVLPPVPFNRTFTPFLGDPKQYGMGGGQGGFNGWFANNAAPLHQPQVAGAPQQQRRRRAYAKGGGVNPGAAQMGGLEAAMGSRFVQGAGGAREDKIPALLSNNEYVIDAETTALLGDGDPATGAKKLDAMRANIRKHKGKALAKGKISPDAKPAAEHYMGARR